MQKINKMLSRARHEAEFELKRKESEDLTKYISRMTTEQLRELIDGNPSDERVREIFASVGGLQFYESGGEYGTA